MPPAAVAVVTVTPARKPAGRVVVAAVASSSTESIAVAVSSTMACRIRPSIAGVECSAMSRVKMLMTRHLLRREGDRGERALPHRDRARPAATNDPAIVGVLARVGIDTMPARPNENLPPLDANAG